MSSEDKNIIVCDICGREILDDEECTQVGNDLVCEECLEEHFTRCNDCGEYVPTDEITVVANGDVVCEHCLDNYSYCDDCNEYFPSDKTTYLDTYDRTVCESCLDNNYTKCRECGEYVDDNDIIRSEDGEYYCENCYDELYTTCEDCGCEIYREDAYERDGCLYCEECYNNLDDEDEDGNGIYNYHGFNHNNYIPRYAKGENMTGVHLYGMELEVAGSTSYAREVVDLLEGNAISMYDSSVDGFELVFMPMSRRYIYENLKPVLEKALTFMTDKGFRGHNKGGIHVHFTKLEDSTQVANMTKIMYGSEQDRKIWLKITQRKEQNMHWCSMTSCVPSSKEIIEGNITAPAGYGNHGTALNFCTRTNTHELRIFNSSTRIERVMKNLECVFALEDYVAQPSEPICDTRGFLNFIDIHASDYPILAQFLHEKKVFEIASKFYGDTYTSKIKTDVVTGNSEVTNGQNRPVEPTITIEVTNASNEDLDFSSIDDFNIDDVVTMSGVA